MIILIPSKSDIKDVDMGTQVSAISDTTILISDNNSEDETMTQHTESLNVSLVEELLTYYDTGVIHTQITNMSDDGRSYELTVYEPNGKLDKVESYENGAITSVEAYSSSSATNEELGSYTVEIIEDGYYYERPSNNESNRKTKYVGYYVNGNTHSTYRFVLLDENHYVVSEYLVSKYVVLNNTFGYIYYRTDGTMYSKSEYKDNEITRYYYNKDGSIKRTEITRENGDKEFFDYSVEEAVISVSELSTYYQSGALKTQVDKINQDGSYSLIVYEPDGTYEMIEYYNSDGVISSVDIYDVNTMSLEGENVPVVINNDGYYIEIQNDQDQNNGKGYHRIYFSTEKHQQDKIEYYNSYGKLYSTLDIHKVLNKDGSFEYNYYNEDGSLYCKCIRKEDRAHSYYYNGEKIEYENIVYKNGKTEEKYYK